jgi:general secretion pathway protein G
MSKSNKIIIVVSVLFTLFIFLLCSVFIPSVVSKPISTSCQFTIRDLRAITLALELFQSEEGKYPSNEIGLKALTQEGKKGQTYLDKMLKDPWGKLYIYKYPARYNTKYEYDLYSSGENKQDENGFNDDINYWAPTDCPNPSWISGVIPCLLKAILIFGLPLYILLYLTRFIYLKIRKT